MTSQPVLRGGVGVVRPADHYRQVLFWHPDAEYAFATRAALLADVAKGADAFDAQVEAERIDSFECCHGCLSVDEGAEAGHEEIVAAAAWPCALLREDVVAPFADLLPIIRDADARSDSQEFRP